MYKYLNNYIFSLQVCFKDLWFLETEKPPAPSRVQLVRASTNTLEVCWGSVPTADAYLLQLQKYDLPPAQTVTPAAVPMTNTLTKTQATTTQSQPTIIRAPAPASGRQLLFYIWYTFNGVP